ncbi:NAD(+) synthetase, partial [candidate division KSB1 bacterium]
TKAVVETLSQFISDCVSKSGCKKGIIGLSGGVDSTVSTYLSVKALGKENVITVIMPYKTSSPDSEIDAVKISELLGIKYIKVDITPMVDEYFKLFPDADNNRRGNKMARERMSILYDISAKERGLVIGTSNKSEILLGYGTIFGDLACGINPLGDLYKTQIYQIARELNVPEEIICKKPTADLWLGQYDEDEIGFRYSEIDRLLYYMVDKKYDEKKLLEIGFKKKMIDEIKSRIKKNHFKRIPPLIAKISERTIGHEFKYIWDWSST